MRGLTLGVAAVALALASLAAPQARANLLTNGNFATGDFTGWSESGNTGFTGVSCVPFDGYTPPVGSCFAYLGAENSLNFLSQTVTDVNGMSYTLSFLMGSDGGTPNEFDVEWDGNTLFDQTNLADTNGFVPMSFTVTGTGTDTLTFSSQNNPGYQALTNATLGTPTVPVPEPATLSLFGAALAGLGILRRRRKSA